MGRAPIGAALRQVERIFGAGTVAGLTEGQLLERFVGSNDDAAFEAIVRRHGPAVMAVCRRLLGDPHEAEDAFQATFLVLARRAGSLGRSRPIGPWLVGVAYRVASKARVAAARRRRREAVAAGRRAEAVSPAEPTACDLAPAIWEELHRLPARYRDPVVLCWLQGHSHGEAAERLRWPIGTVKGRLHRARETLRSRLALRGITAPAAGLAAWFRSEAIAALIPPPVLGPTIKAAVAVSAGGALAAGVVPAGAVLLARGALRAMTLTQLSTSAAAVLVAGGTLAGGWGVVSALDGPGTAPAPAGTTSLLAAPVPGAEDPPDAAESGASDPFAPRRDDRVAIRRGTAGTVAGVSPFAPRSAAIAGQPGPGPDTGGQVSPAPGEFDVSMARRHLDTVSRAFQAGNTDLDRYLAAMKLLLASRLDAASDDERRVAAFKEYHAQLQALRAALDAPDPTYAASPRDRDLIASEFALAEAAVLLGEGILKLTRQGGMPSMGSPADMGMMSGYPSMGSPADMGMMSGYISMLPRGGRRDATANAPGADPSGTGARGSSRTAATIGDENDLPDHAGGHAPGTGRNEDPASMAIMATLETPISIPFEKETPLRDVLEYIRQATASEERINGIPIYVDLVGIQNADQTLDSPVMIDLEGIPLRTTLWLTLRQLDLAYTVIDGVLIVSEEGDLKAMLSEEPMIGGPARSPERPVPSRSPSQPSPARPTATPSPF